MEVQLDPASSKIEKTMTNSDVIVPAVLLSLIPTYLENRRREVSLLREALKVSDFEVIKNIAHKLKGNAGSYGFHDLSKMGKNLEDAALAKDTHELISLLNIYDDYLQHVRYQSSET